jgi:hypothetical protein
MQHGEPMPEEVQAKSEEPDDEQRLFVSTRSTGIRCKVAFFLLRHVTFSFLGGCKYLNVAIRRHSSAPLAGLVTKSWARGAATHV